MQSIAKIVEAILIAYLQKNHSNNNLFRADTGPAPTFITISTMSSGCRGRRPYSICNKFVFGRMQYAPTNPTSHLTLHTSQNFQFAYLILCVIIFIMTWCNNYIYTFYSTIFLYNIS